MEARRLWQDLQGPCQLQRARPATEERTQEENLVPPKAPGIMVSGKVDCQPLMSRILPRLWKTEPGNAPRAQRRTDHDQEKGEEGGGGTQRRTRGGRTEAFHHGMPIEPRAGKRPAGLGRNAAGSGVQWRLGACKASPRGHELACMFGSEVGLKQPSSAAGERRKGQGGGGGRELE